VFLIRVGRMFDSIDEIEEIVKSEEFKYVKKKVLLMDANIRMARSVDELLSLKKEMDEFFEKLKSDPKLYMVFAFNKYMLYKELQSRLGNDYR